MAIPDVSADDIVAVLREFDNAKRDTDAWRGWETRRNHVYAISWNGRFYPVKETIRSATGGLSEFGGGAQANRYLRERGFEIVPLRRGDLAISPDGLSRLDCALDRFAEFRRVDEPRYLADERTYKVDLFDHLRKIWDKLYEDPEESKQELVGLMRGEGVDSRLVAAIDNLLGGRGFATRDDFAIYLENINDDEYVRIMGDLFEGDGAPSARLDEFRKSVNGAYTHLYDEGKFHSGKKTRPLLQQCFAAILLASYDPDSYILYRYTEYKKTAEWIGLTVPSTPEQCYTLYLDMAMYILDRAREGNWPVWDLVDVHNMIYMLWRYDEFKDLLTEDERVVSGESVYTFIRKHHFIFPDWLVTDYILSLATKPFVILSGISGTGKTKLGQLVAEYVMRATGGRARKAFVSVRPDWTDNSYLLGWYNAIAERYETTAVLDLILEASGEPEIPHFIILDEMNIAKVEHYFSDFLSAMESRWIDAGGKVHQEPIRLHNQGDEGEWGPGPGVPSEIALPLNVYVTGTVNVDESTYMFSPKVLDRANVIEFNDVCLDPDLYRQTEIPVRAPF